MILHDENGIEIAGLKIADHILARMGWLLPLLTVIFSMSIHAMSGHPRAIPFFISESDYPGIERWIFTTGLGANGVILCIITFRFRHLFQNSEKVNLSRLSFFAGTTTGSALTVLAFANMYDALVLHCIVAIIVFGGGILWGVSSHLLFESTEQLGKRLRRIGLAIAAFGFVTMNCILMFYISTHREELNNADQSILLLDHIQSAINYAAPAEYLLFLGLVITLASFELDLKAPVAPQSND